MTVRDEGVLDLERLEIDVKEHTQGVQKPGVEVTHNTLFCSYFKLLFAEL